MRATFAVIAASLLLAGCEPEPQAGYLARDGEGVQWRIITCRMKDICMNKAARMCPGGYIDRNDLKNPKEMMVRCKNDGATVAGDDPSRKTELADWK